MIGLVEWAWSAIEIGPEGCQQVVEVWEAIAKGEHLELREGPNAINWAYKPRREFKATTPSAPKPPAFLYAAYISAKSVTHRQTSLPERPTFASLLPSFLDPSFPALHRWLNHTDAETWLNRAFTTPGHASDPDSFSIAITWLRQVALAQIWYEQRSLPGLGLVRHVRGAFQRSAHKQIWELWFTLSQAIDSEEYRWISTKEWESSARQRWVNSEGSAALEEEEGKEQNQDSQDFLSESTPTNEPSVQPPSSTLASTSLTASPVTSLPPALLTQAIVNPFLSGFVRAQLLQQANQIWAWLVGHSPPLNPGIVTWNGLLTGYAQRGDVNAVENAWLDLGKSGIQPNLWTWLARIDACFNSKRCDDAMLLFRSMMADKEVLKEVEREYKGRFPEVVWDKLINGLLANGRREEAEDILADMEKTGSIPTIHTVNIFLKYYTRGKNPDLPSVVRMLKLISERELEADVFTYTMVLVALLAAGQKDATAKTIQIMESTRVKPTVTTYGAIIHSLAHSGQPEHLTAAVQLLDEMERRKMQTNEIIYTSLVQGFLRAIPATPLRSNIAAENEDGQHPYFRAALTLKTRMERRGIQLNRVGYNAFLGSALALQSDWGVQLALKIFKEMKRRPGLMNASSSSTSEEEETVEPRDEQYSEMGRDGKSVTPSDTYFILLDGFVKMKDWNRARGIVREMERTGFEVRNKGLRRLVERIGGGSSGLS
jgi:pentatricopeptide repeat protein